MNFKFEGGAVFKTMPNIKSAKKRVSIAAIRTARNKAVKSNMKTFLKKAQTEVVAGADSAENSVRLAIKAVDKACAKGVLHKKTAARKKSQLARLISAK